MGPHKPRPRRVDDIDDFMASIFKNESPKKPAHTAPLFAHTPQPKQKKQAQHPFRHTKPQPKPPLSPKSPPNPSRKKRDLKISLGKPLLAFVVAALFIGITVVIWQGPLQSLLYPSPFSDETKQKMGETPLYFPTALPDGYKIERDTMKFPSGGVLVFAASNDEGAAVTFSLQSKPSGLDTKPFTDKLTNTTSVEASGGQAVIGEDTDEKRIASYTTDKIWILVTADKSQVSTQQLEAIVKSLRKG